MMSRARGGYRFSDFYCVWLKNFSPTCTDKELNSLLQRAGCCVVWVARDVRDPQKATALFRSFEDAAVAYARAMSGGFGMEISFYPWEQTVWDEALEQMVERCEGAASKSQLSQSGLRAAHGFVDEDVGTDSPSHSMWSSSFSTCSTSASWSEIKDCLIAKLKRDLKVSEAKLSNLEEEYSQKRADYREALQLLEVECSQTRNKAEQKRLALQQQLAAPKASHQKELTAVQRNFAKEAKELEQSIKADQLQRLARQLEEAEAAAAIRAEASAKELRRVTDELSKQEAAWKELLQKAEQGAEALRQQVEERTVQLDRIRKDFGERLLCPLSFQPMLEPVIGTDLRTYQKDAIETSLDLKPASPFTRGFMEKSSLRPNILATDFLELMTKHFPDWEASTAIPRSPTAHLVGDELLDAMRSLDSDLAIELLGRDVELETLNTGYRYQTVCMNLLSLAISLGLPKVALAISNRLDFRRTESPSSKGIMAIHMAAAFNYVDVCRRIVEDVGGYALQARTLGKVELVDPSGRSVVIPKGSVAVECARLFGHDPTWAESDPTG